MSVDYYSCECCGEAKYGEYISECEECGKSLCYNCIVNAEGDWFEIINNNDGMIPREHCPFCSGLEIDNKELLDFILNKYEIDLDREKDDFLKNKVIH